MKNSMQFITLLFLLVQTIGFSQTENSKSDAIEIATSTEAVLAPDKLKDFIGIYFLAEADFELEIVQEDDQLYIISPFSKDIMIQTNETTLTEPTRGVDLELIPDNENALKYTQNGYETTIKRMTSKIKK